MEVIKDPSEETYVDKISIELVNEIFKNKLYSEIDELYDCIIRVINDNKKLLNSWEV